MNEDSRLESEYFSQENQGLAINLKKSDLSYVKDFDPRLRIGKLKLQQYMQKK